MSKSGEMNYINKLNADELNHAINKPFSDLACDHHLIDIGMIFSLLPKPPAKLLDLGCGTGWTSYFYAKRGYDVTGVDISADMIHFAELRNKEEKCANIKFVVKDYEELIFNEEYDCAIFYDSLHHSAVPELALRKVYMALKWNGVCITCEPGKGHSKQKRSLEAVEKYEVTENDLPPTRLRKLGKRNGFRQIRIYPRLSEIAKVVTNRVQNEILKNLFKNDIIKSAVMTFVSIYHKQNNGIVVMLK